MKKIEIARQYVEKYIDLALKYEKQYSKREIATVIYNENPDVFQSVEDARRQVRIATNAAGTEKYSENNEALARRFALVPEAIRDTTTDEPFVVPVSIKKTLWVSDIHGRFYDKEAFQIAVNEGIKQGCDSVIINGDFLDFYQDSKFDKNPAISIIFEEQEWGTEILSILQDVFGYVVLKQGNHDIRRERHIERLSMSMPELLNMSSYSDYLFFDGCKVQFVEDYRHIVYGKLNGIHGHEYYGGGGIHVAHNRLMKAFDNVISGHSHKPQSKIKPDINGIIYGSWALGCLCDLHPRYSPKNEWAHGFAITQKDSTGEFSVDNKVIYNKRLFSV